MTPEEYCQDKAASSGSSFYYSFRFLTPDRRRAITAVYAFCREVDDIADECPDPQIAQAKLAWWREEITRTFEGNASHPVGKALTPAIDAFALEKEPFNEIIAGMEMDLTCNRYADFTALQLYCHRVAGVVGQLAATIFGYSDPATLQYAHKLGLAFQLTNIIRDVGEDARRNRIYLPQAELQRFGVTESDILNSKETEPFHRLMTFQVDRARDHYRQAFADLPAADRRAQRPGIIMAAIYGALLSEIAADGCHVLRQRTSLTPLRKLWIAWRTWIAG